MKFRFALTLLIVLSFSGFALSQSLEGTVINGTTGKAAAGADVTLLSLANGMSEAGHTKTDSQGHFSLALPAGAGMPNLVRVTHQNVSYFKMAPPGTNTVDVQIYDAAPKVEGIATSVQIMRLQSSGGSLQVIELYAVQNSSSPPRTLMPDRAFDIALPKGAVIDQAAAKAPNGQPINAMPSPIPGSADRYSFNFPLRPGETQFQLAYHLPYGGQATIKPTLLHDVQHFVALLPKAMQFTPANGVLFTSMPDDSGTNVQVVTNAKAGQNVAFTVSGTGVLTDDNPSEAQASGAPGGAMPAGPGGGLGNPIGSPDPLTQYRWPLLGVLALMMVAGGFYVVSRRTPDMAEAAGTGAAAVSLPLRSSPADSGKTAPAASRSTVLLEAVKEELFQLEVERQQGRISEEEYAKSKEALDRTMKRALSKS